MILTLEQQVTSLESSKRLRDFGCQQESLFYWVTYTSKFMSTVPFITFEYDSVRHNKLCSAYTCAELLEILPDDTELSRRNHQYYICNCDIGSGQQWIHCRQDNLLAIESLALMLIYLIENKLIVIGKDK